ncbi:MAG: glycerol-3-phosphate 1-O-acyltransferase PlsY [Actinobacteria bacterium]|nr:glycerol-3-phosphate 1-O-acyltransferase PlsY [Actinomycetota bacterium]
MHYVIVVAVALLGYLMGTFPSAIIIARANGIDITTQGSGNPGASNVARTLGWKKGLVVYVLDAVKGVAAVIVGRLVAGDAGGYWCAAAVIVGHVFPLTRGFHGGKGVATGSGAIVVLQPVLSTVLFALWMVVSKTTKKASIASIVVTIGVPVGTAILGAPLWEILAMVGLAMLVVARHLPNLRRLRSGTENSLKGKTA